MRVNKPLKTNTSSVNTSRAGASKASTGTSSNKTSSKATATTQKSTQSNATQKITTQTTQKTTQLKQDTFTKSTQKQDPGVYKPPASKTSQDAKQTSSCRSHSPVSYKKKEETIEKLGKEEGIYKHFVKPAVGTVGRVALAGTLTAFGVGAKAIAVVESVVPFAETFLKRDIVDEFIGEKQYIDRKVEERVQEKDEEYERMLDSSNFIERIIFHQDPAERRSKAKSEIVEELLKSKEEGT